MMINALRNRRSGPGGSARHLHRNGGEQESTRVVKAEAFIRVCTAVIGRKIINGKNNFNFEGDLRADNETFFETETVAVA